MSAQHECFSSWLIIVLRARMLDHFFKNGMITPPVASSVACDVIMTDVRLSRNPCGNVMNDHQARKSTRRNLPSSDVWMASSLAG